MTITLTGKEIRDLAEAVGLVIAKNDYAEELETEMVIVPCPEAGVLNDDGEPEHYRYIAWLEEYPEEGSCPLGDKLKEPK